MWNKFINNPLGSNPQFIMMEGDAGDGQGGQGGTPIDGNSQKFIEKMDPVTGKSVKIPAELDAVIGHFISKTRTDVESKYKPILEQLESEKSDFETIKSEYEKLRQESMTAEERAQENARKKIQEHERVAKEKHDEAVKWRGMFEKSTIKNDIMASFGDTKLCNPGQVATLFEMEGGAFISEIVDDDGKPTGKFETRLKVMLEDDNGNLREVEGTPEQLFKKWIALDRNAHHLVNTMSPGTGSRGGGNRGGGMSQDEILKLSPAARIQYGREQSKSK